MHILEQPAYIVGAELIRSAHQDALSRLVADLALPMQDEAKRPLYGHTAALILFDAIARGFIADASEDTLDSRIIRDTWGRNATENYRIVDMVYAARRGAVVSFRERYRNIAEDKGFDRFAKTSEGARYAWFLEEISLPFLELQTMLIGSIRMIGSADLVQMGKEGLASRDDSAFLPKPIIEYFGL